jgi:DNA-binding transcriptional regulator YiaG
MHIMETAAHFEPPLDFSQRVKALRNRLGFSQEQFAEVFAVSSATVKLWEKGGLYPSQQDWQRIVLGEVEGVEALHSNGHTRKMLHCSFSK